jgi:UDP-N-acetylmuramoyl-L-alanyl-D-glutamate--2,6-diaminopimelate ligase
MATHQKYLSWLFQGYDVKGRLEEASIDHITCDSRQVNPGSLFVAVKGLSADGHAFIKQAIAHGAAAIVSERPVKSSIPVLEVQDSRHALAFASRRFYDYPDRSLIMIGVTGTNGKTTVAYLLEALLNACGLRCGLLGTVQYRWPGHRETASHTTPDAVRLYQTLRDMVESGVAAVAMEVSSHALEQHRVSGIQYRAAIFTNLTHDHLDYHPDMDSYAQAKAKLFHQLSPEGSGVINSDDPYGRLMLDQCLGKRITYGEKGDPTYRIERCRVTPEGSHFRLIHHNEKLEFFTPLLGEFNVVNASAAVIAALDLGLNIEQISKGLTGFERVPGRMEGFRAPLGFWVVVDYAHTPDALQNALKTARAFTSNHLVTVFGCGGDRDRKKRPEMGRIAAELSHHVIVTSDNPRTEDPERIIRDILEGLPASASFQVVEDRETAIREALIQAVPGDTVIIAGKGHEDYQILGHKRIHFDDREIVQKYLNG